MPTTPMSVPCCTPASPPSAALATAEHVGASGPDVLAAVVAGYEVTIRIGLAVQPGHFQRGFQSTGTCDVFGTAAAAGRLLFGGTDERVLAAIGLAGSYSSGVAQFYYSGASGKRIQAAHAAQSGVAAALLTQHGFAGPVDMIEGSGGFARAYADGFNPAIIEDGLGSEFLLMDVPAKSHAAAARVAAGIDAMLALRQQHGFSGDDIASMHLGIPKVIQGRLTNPHPVDLQAAQMCLPFSVALASHLPLAAGRISTLAVADFENGLRDRRLFEIEDRTTIAIDDEVEARESRALHRRQGRAFVCATGASSRNSCRRRREVPAIRSRRRSTRRVLCRSCRAGCPTRSARRSSRCRRTSTGSTRAGLGRC